MTGATNQSSARGSYLYPMLQSPLNCRCVLLCQPLCRQLDTVFGRKTNELLPPFVAVTQILLRYQVGSLSSCEGLNAQVSQYQGGARPKIVLLCWRLVREGFTLPLWGSGVTLWISFQTETSVDALAHATKYKS